LRGFVLLALIAFFWGINWPILKVGILEIPAFTYRAITFPGGALIMFAICRAQGLSLRLPRRVWLPLVLMASGVASYQVLMCYGLERIPSGRASVMAYTIPVWTVILGLFILNERLDWRRLTALALGLGGMALLLVDDISALGGAPVGMIFMVATAISISFSTVIQKKVDWQTPTLVVVAWQTAIAGIPAMIGAAVIDYSDVGFPGPLAIFSLVYNVVIGVAFGLWAYFELVRVFPVGIATIGIMLVPVIGVFSGALTLGEPLGITEFGAMVLVCAAIGVPVLPRRQNWRRGSTAQS